MQLIGTLIRYTCMCFVGTVNPDSIIHGTNMGPAWVLTAPGGPHVAPMNLALRGDKLIYGTTAFCCKSVCDKTIASMINGIYGNNQVTISNWKRHHPRLYDFQILCSIQKTSSCGLLSMADDKLMNVSDNLLHFKMLSIRKHISIHYHYLT